MSGPNLSNINPPASIPPHLLQQLMTNMPSAKTPHGGAGTPGPQLQTHMQLLDLLRNPPPHQDRQEALADFIKQSNEASRKDRRAPKFKTVSDKNIEHLQTLLQNRDTNGVQAFMRKNRWTTLTLIMGDEVVTLCRPKSKKGDMRYVSNHLDSAKDDANSGSLLELTPSALATMAAQLLQQPAAQVVGNGKTDPVANDPNATDPNATDLNATSPSDARRADPDRTSVTVRNTPPQTHPSDVHLA